MIGAEALWQSLRSHDIDVIFGFPGGAVIPVYDVMPKSGIRHVLVRHEQAAAMAADGYARATGRLGACIATSGPGAMNLLCGLANAFLDSVPVLAITGQVPTGQLGRDAFQETDVFGATMPLTKHNYLLARAADLPRVINEAVYLAQAGRKGPVLVDLPRDVAEAEVPEDVDTTPRLPGYRPRLDGHPAQLARAADALASARRPFILAGGGVKWAGASPWLRRLAEKMQVPVGSTLMGLGCFPADHPLYLGMVGMHGSVAANRAVQECDVLLALGVRFSDRVTGKRDEFATGAQLIHVDVDPTELGKNVPAHVPIVGDVGRVLRSLLNLVPERPAGDWVEQVASFRAEPALDGMGVETVKALARATSDLARQDRLVLVTDVGQHQMWVAQHFPVYHPRTLLTSGGLGAMGYGLPAAVGAQIGCPDKTVVLVTGDGSFQINLQELATVKQEGLPLKIVLLDNGSLGMVLQWQDMFYGRNRVAVSLTGPDYALLAQAYGLSAWEVSEPSELEGALGELLAHPGPGLVRCRVSPDEKVLPMVPAGQPLARIIVSW
ncbi:MAG TPA: biosynthetic-type acetolactate synthase large subunit [Firmicutes bacterium]|nr:biosynthetic-type acetolactate synthase large subunit [Bacillota bacterium]